MKHTIISWDCSYRNFFHIIDALIDQEYDKNDFELIYVEQRSRSFADQYNHSLGLKALSDRFDDVSSKINFKLEYLNIDVNQPYHLGLCVNRGLELAQGDIISIMDGDMLLPTNFFSVLDKFHEEKIAVANIVRRMVPEPVGVSFEDWTKGIIDYEKCLENCPDGNDPLPPQVSNKGPMISAPKTAWEAVNGYDTHKIWSTGLSRLGQDVNIRLETYLNCSSFTLPDCAAVHPYHPSGFSRRTYQSVRFLSLQDNIIDWTKKHGQYNWMDRKDLVENIYNNNREFIDFMTDGNLSRPDKGKSYFTSNEFLDSLVGKTYEKLRKYIKMVPVEWRV